MIKINLLAERKQAKAKTSATSLKIEGGGGGRNLLLAGILILGLVGVVVLMALRWTRELRRRARR